MSWEANPTRQEPEQSDAPLCISRQNPGKGYIIFHALDPLQLEQLRESGIQWLAVPLSQNPHLLAREVGDRPMLMAEVDMGPEAILEGYRAGCFPYPNQQEPGVRLAEKADYYWHRPDPRTVFMLDSRAELWGRLRRSLRNPKYSISVNQDFEHCVTSCATNPRTASSDHASKPWINDELIAAYNQLHRSGSAFNIAVHERSSGAIVGGLFGINIGGFVTIESMFREEGGTSKPAFAALLTIAAREGIKLVDVQLPAAHWTSWEAMAIKDHDFLVYLGQAVGAAPIDWSVYEGALRQFTEH